MANTWSYYNIFRLTILHYIFKYIMIQFQLINNSNIYILTKHSHYYTIEKQVENGKLYIKCDKTSLSEHIGYIKNYNVELNKSLCKSLGISYKNDKFYLMNLFIYGKHDIVKIDYERTLLFKYISSKDNIDTCIYNNNKPQYKLYDKVIVYGLKCNCIDLELLYISTENILIIEDASDVLCNRRTKDIYSDIERLRTIIL